MQLSQVQQHVVIVVISICVAVGVGWIVERIATPRPAQSNGSEAEIAALRAELERVSDRRDAEIAALRAEIERFKGQLPQPGDDRALITRMMFEELGRCEDELKHLSLSIRAEIAGRGPSGKAGFGHAARQLEAEYQAKKDRCKEIEARLRGEKPPVRLAEGAPANRLTVDLESPRDGGTVSAREIAEGKVSDPKARVWVIVHPVLTEAYWVQPEATVQASGDWRAMICIAPGNSGGGELFEIRAVANPTSALKEGLALSGWPEAEGKSETFRVSKVPSRE